MVAALVFQSRSRHSLPETSMMYALSLIVLIAWLLHRGAGRARQLVWRLLDEMGRAARPQAILTFSPLGPFGPCPRSNVTACPS